MDRDVHVGHMKVSFPAGILSFSRPTFLTSSSSLLSLSSQRVLRILLNDMVVYLMLPLLVLAPNDPLNRTAVVALAVRNPVGGDAKAAGYMQVPNLLAVFFHLPRHRQGAFLEDGNDGFHGSEDARSICSETCAAGISWGSAQRCIQFETSRPGEKKEPSAARSSPSCVCV